MRYSLRERYICIDRCDTPAARYVLLCKTQKGSFLTLTVKKPPFLFSLLFYLFTDRTISYCSIRVLPPTNSLTSDVLGTNSRSICLKLFISSLSSLVLS